MNKKLIIGLCLVPIFILGFAVGELWRDNKVNIHWFGEMAVGYKNDKGEFVVILDDVRIGMKPNGTLVTDFEKE